MDKRIIDARAQNSKAYRWVESYRNHAHRVASINPVPFQEPAKTESHLLEYSRYGLSRYDSVDLLGVVSSDTTSALTVEQLEQLLQQIYCGTSSIELAYIENEHEREWLTENYEQLFHSILATSNKKEIAELLLKSQAFDNFLATKFPTVKRYGGEGAESIMAFYRQLFLCAAEADLSNIVVGMPHRGKLNVLTTLFQTRPVKIFRKFKGLPEFPADAKAMCDIANHFSK